MTTAIERPEGDQQGCLQAFGGNSVRTHALGPKSDEMGLG